MVDILTPDRIAIFRGWVDMSLMVDACTLRGALAEALDSHEVLEADRDSWQATVEEAMDKNVNKSLTQRHEMREASLKEQLAKAHADVLALANELREFEDLRFSVLTRPSVKQLLLKDQW